MSEHASSDHSDGHSHDDSYYVKVWGVLLVLLAISYVGPWLEIAIVTLLTAFGIAGVKAYLVMKYFMHLDVEKPIVRYFLVTSVVFMVLMFAGVAPDIMKHEGTNWENLAAKAEIERALAVQAAGGGHGEDAGGHDDAGAGHTEGH